MFKDRYHPGVKKDLKKLDSAVRKTIKVEWIPMLLSDPFCGQKLSGPLAGIQSFHFRIKSTNYRIAYMVNEMEKAIDILMIAKRENFYQILKRRLK